MSARRPLLIAIWLITTVAAIAVAWLAVSNAVANVADPVRGVSGARAQAAAVESPTTTPPPADVGTEPPGDATASIVTPAAANPSMPAAAPAPQRPAQPPSSSPQTSAGPVAPEPDPAPGGAEPPATTTTAPASGQATRSFSTNGGIVTVTCQGSTASLQSATPRQGYAVEVGDSGPERVEVQFHRTDGESEFEVRVACVGGTPTSVTDD